MDSYVELLYKAQENNKNATNKEVRCYSTSFTPPKKVERSKVSSANVRKFLARKEEEDKKRTAQAMRKKEELLALRSQDKKAQKRVQVMLKRTKSANKSVMEDAIDNVNTADTLAGSKQCDEDDYGYVSQEASAFYNKLINKYENMPADDTPFSKMKREVKDLSAAKDRVRAALQKEADEELLPHKRKKKKHEEGSEGKDIKEENDTVESREDNDQNSQQEHDKKLAEQKKKRKPLPPPIKFDQLLQLAAKKQHEPIIVVEKPKEPERLMTKKEKSEFFREEERRLNKTKRRSTYLIPDKVNDNEKNPRKDSNTPTITETKSKAKVNKLNEEPKKATKVVESSRVGSEESKKDQSEFSNKEKISGSLLIDRLKKDSSVWAKSVNQTPVNKIQCKEKPFKINKKTDVTSKRPEILQKRPERGTFKSPCTESNNIDASLSDIDREIELLRKKRMLLASKALNENSQTSRGTTKGKTDEDSTVRPKKSEESNQRQKRQEDSIQGRERPAEESIHRKRPEENLIQRKRPEVNSIQRQKRPDDMIQSQKRREHDSIQRQKRPMKNSLDKKKLKKRRIDSDSEYDSELEDFIDDDGIEGDDYSKYISEIFGYDKSKYAAVEEGDECMESNFAQQMKEEYVSTKIGILEDLEDIRQEQEEKKRKAKMKLISRK